MEVVIEVEAPTSVVERELAKVWAQILKVDVSRIGRSTSFFELGGDSISAIQLLSLCKPLGIHLTTALIFKKSTLAQMASLADEEVKPAVVLKPIVVP